MNSLSIQWQRETSAVTEYNRLVKSRALMGINSYTLAFWQTLKADNPGALCIFRFWPNFDEELGIGWVEEPERLAIEAVKMLGRKIGHLIEAGAITHVLGMNEYVHSFHTDWHPAADRFMSTFIREVTSQLGLGTIVLNAACGHFAEETVDLFPLTLDRLAETTHLPPQKRSYLGLHEYDYPNMDELHRKDLANGGDGYWLCGKWRRVMAPIRDRYGPIQCVITECGLDGGVIQQHKKGFRSTSLDVATAARHYCNEHNLKWYKKLLDQDEAVYAAIIFGISMYGGDDGWPDFDIEGTQVPTLIAEMIDWPSEPEPPPPQPPPPEEPMDIKVFDMHGNEQTLQWAKDKYGVAFRRAQGTKAYRLVELREKTGTHSLITQVLDAQGNPIHNKGVAFYWPDAPDPPEPQTEITPHDWHRNFIHGPTNINGDVGPGMGRGAYHGEGEGGPHAVWVRDPNIPSDICEKLGMLAGTPHDHLDQKFQLVEGDTPPPPPGGEGMFVETSRETVSTTQNQIQVELDANSARNFYDTRFEMRIVEPGTNNVWMVFEEVFHPEMRKIMLATDYTPSTGEAAREYQYRVIDWTEANKGKALSAWINGCVFQTGQKTRYNVKMKWQAGSEPPPPPPPPQPPPSGDIPAGLRNMADKLDLMATELDQIADQWPSGSPGAQVTEVRVMYSDNTQKVFRPDAVSAAAATLRKLIGR